MHRSEACGDKEDEGKRDEKIQNNDSIEIRKMSSSSFIYWCRTCPDIEEYGLLMWHDLISVKDKYKLWSQVAWVQILTRLGPGIFRNLVKTMDLSSEKCF